MKKKISIFVALACAVMVLALAVSAAGPRPKRGDVMGATPDTVNAVWVTGVSEDGGAKGQSIQMTDFDFYSFRNWWDQKLSDVTKVRASFMAATGAVNGGGSPRFSLELDANGDGALTCDPGLCADAVVVYLDPSTCSDLAQSGWNNADFTGDPTNCVITDSTTASYASDASGTAWSKLVAAYPDAKVWFMFLIQDATTGSNYVDRIMLDSAFFTKQP